LITRAKSTATTAVMSAMLNRSAARKSRPASRSFSVAKNWRARACPRCAELGNLRVVHRPGQRALGQRRRAVAHRFGDRQQALELDAPVPARDLGLFGRRDAEHRRLGEARLEPRRDRRVVGEEQAVVGAQDRAPVHLRIDGAKGVAELLAAAQVDLDRLVATPFSASRMRARRGLGAVLQS
jgi:hypothetical protein